MELLIAVGLSAILGVMVMAGFHSTLRLWQQIEDRSLIDSGWVRFSREFTRDVRRSTAITRLSSKTVILQQQNQYVRWQADSTASALKITRRTSASSKNFREKPGDITLLLPHDKAPLSLQFSSPGPRTVLAKLVHGNDIFILRESLRHVP